MKHRCMCGKPDYILEKGDVREYEFANPRDINSSEIYKHKMMRFFSRLQEPTLHFKSADRECERCGRPLCKDCMIPRLSIAYVYQDRQIIDKTLSCLCPICARRINEWSDS